MVNCLPDTAMCDLNDLLDRGLFRKILGGGVVRGMRWAIG